MRGGGNKCLPSLLQSQTKPNLIPVIKEKNILLSYCWIPISHLVWSREYEIMWNINSLWSGRCFGAGTWWHWTIQTGIIWQAGPCTHTKLHKECSEKAPPFSAFFLLKACPYHSLSPQDSQSSNPGVLCLWPSNHISIQRMAATGSRVIRAHWASAYPITLFWCALGKIAMGVVLPRTSQP